MGCLPVLFYFFVDAFILVHQDIKQLLERFDAQSSVLVVNSIPHAEFDLESQVPGFIMHLDVIFYSADGYFQVGLVCYIQDDEKLIAAIPCNKVFRTDTVFKQPGRSLQNIVSNVMAKRIID